MIPSTNGQTGMVKPVYPHFNFVEVEGKNQYFGAMLLQEAEMPSNFTTSVNYMIFRIAEFTNNMTLTSRI